MPRLLSLLGLAAVLSALWGCGSRSDESFWSPLALEGASEVESYESFEAMKAAADIVLQGRVVSVALGRVFHGDAEEDTLQYVDVALDVDAMIKGPAASSVVLEFLSPAGVGEQAGLATMRSTIPEDPVLVFIRDKGGKERGLYRLVNSAGLWANAADGQVTAPLVAEQEVVEQFLESTEPENLSSVEVLTEALD